MKVQNTADIRNIALIGHGGAGKTSLVSAFLFSMGIVNRLGKTADGTAITDFDEEEIERQISINTAICYCEYKKKKLNFIDTPGYANFIAEARGALKVADGALMVVCGVSGVEVQTERTWKYAEEFGIPIVFVINKLDRERGNFERAIESLHKIFGRTAIPIQIPIGTESEFRGVIDLINMKALHFESDASGKCNELEIPDRLKEEARTMKDQLVELIAENDDRLMETFFEKGELTLDEITSGLKQAVIQRRIFPVCCASASRNIGTGPILDAIINFMPSPGEREDVTGINPKDKSEIARKPSKEEPYSAFVFKTIADPYAGKISLIRVYSGTIRSDSTVYNASREINERLGGLSFLQGKNQTPAEEVIAGDIAAVAKLKETKTGDTFSDKDNPIIIKPVLFPEPAISFAIEPKAKGDEDKISIALQKIAEEDQILRINRDQQTNELLVSGSGMAHLEVVVSKMKKKFGVDAILKQPKVPYRETIKKKVEAQGKYKKQTGGRGQYGDCKIIMEPLPRGSNFEFIDKIFGGAIPQNFRPAVEKGIQEARQQGLLAGYPVVDFRVTLVDGSYHVVDSSELAFKIAGSMAFKKAMEEASPTILEPIMNVEIITPDEYMGDIMGDLNSRRGKVSGMDSQGSAQVIKAQVPMSEMLTYATTLKSITGDRGSYSMEFSHYDEVPAHIQQKIISQAKISKEEKEE
ncbi:MAG: elongation factor G [Acidobacteriota bacterium]